MSSNYLLNVCIEFFNYDWFRFWYCKSLILFSIYVILLLGVADDLDFWDLNDRYDLFDLYETHDLLF